MNSSLISKFKLIGEFSLMGGFAGFVYQLINVGFVDFEATVMGIPLGAAYGIIELFILSGFRQKLLKFPLMISIIIKAVVYLLIIQLITGALGLIAGAFQGKSVEEFYDSIFSKDQLILTLYTLLLYVFFSFYIQINVLLGDGVLLKFMLGKYRKPTAEHRIFMFLDIKSSTTIAEKLGLDQYYSLLNDFFHEISEPVRETNAEIYQYVGDEVVFTWTTKKGVNDANCLKMFFKIRSRVNDNRKYYQDKYGVIPEFKAGLHFGEVISAQIGDIKREIVYNGDVLNTSARIQEQCNVYQKELLLSGALLSKLDIENEYQAEKIDSIKLRGKENSIELYSLVQA